MVTRIVVPLLVLLVTFGASGALAQDATDAQAAALFRRGVALGEEERWAEAHELFRRSQELVNRPATLFNLAYAAYRMGRFVDAIDYLDQYAAAGSAARAADATALRADALALLAEVEVRVTPVDARLIVDGRELSSLGAVRTVALDPGPHHIVARADAHTEVEVQLVLTAGERSSRTITLVPSPEVTMALSPAVASPTDIGSEPLFWVALIGGVLVVSGAVTAGVIAGTASSPAPDGGSTGVVVEALRF